MEDITAGCSPTHFCPDARVTRVQMAQFLARALHLPASTTDYFDDDDGMTGEGNINALAKAGLTTGCGTRRFCPTRTVTRAQMALFLARALHLPMTTTDYFDDDDGLTGEGSHQRHGQGGPDERLRAAPLLSRPRRSAASRWPRCSTALWAADAPLHCPTMSLPGTSTWVVLPTYNEADNIRPLTAAVLGALPDATLLVVDDSSPDGTGEHRRRACGRRSARPRPAPCRRSRASAGRISTGSRWRLTAGAGIVVQMDADFSHDPAALPSLRRADPARRSGPRHRVPLHARRRRGRLGARPAADLPRRVAVRAGRPGPLAERPDRRVQGLARRRRSGPSRSTASTPVATSSRSR